MLIVSVASVQQPNSRKVLKMGGATNVTKADFDFEDYVLTPLSPFTPYENTERETARGGQAKLKFTTVSLSPLRRLPTNEALQHAPNSNCTCALADKHLALVGTVGTQEEHGEHQEKEGGGGHWRNLERERKPPWRVQVWQVRFLPKEGKGERANFPLPFLLTVSCFCGPDTHTVPPTHIAA
jgi:hypothetical protein